LVVVVSDGGGVVQAALAPILGAGPVAEVLSRIAAAVSLQPAQVNGNPALIIRLNGEVDTVIAVRIDDGLITGLYAVRNPEKLSRVGREIAVSR
jgi:RNA polymerase sigma-70 factor (ECF subfamily)